MKKSLFLALSLPFAAGLALAACDDDSSKDVCDEAADVINDCDLPEGEDTGGDGGEAPACEGEVAAQSQCFVDYPDQACILFEDPLNTDGYADLSECVTAASGS